MSTRRKFLQQSAFAAAGSLLIPGFLKSVEAKPHLIQSHKTLVVIQLSGGNDGLNTIVPYTNDLYYSMRPLVAIPRTQVLPATDSLGFHPSLAKLNELYDKGYLSIVNNVGYPNPDRSHFRSMDIWQTASGASEYLNTGWLGRYLDSSCQSCSVAHHAIELDDTLSLALKGLHIKGVAMKDPKKLVEMLDSEIIKSISKSRPEFQQPELDYLYKTLAETTSSAEYIFDKSKVYKSNANYPDNQFGAQLKTVAQLIHSRVDTKVYYVSLSGFDTHIKQQPQHARILTVYADAVHAFVKDLERNNSFEDVVIMTFSEFGRRVSQNANRGTDHGTANNLFLIGKNLKRKGIVNGSPDLRKLDQGDLIHEIDFRNVYATILDNWLAADSNAILNGRFKSLDLL